MARFTAKYWNGQWWERDEWSALLAAQPPRPKAPYVIRDSMSDTVNPVNGLTYDSKSAYYQAVKDAGCVIVGNDIPTPEGPRELEMPNPGPDIKQAIEQLNARS